MTADEWARFFGHVTLFERLKELKTRIVDSVIDTVRRG